MNSYVKLTAFIFCLFPVVTIAGRMLGPSPYDKPLPAQPPHLHHQNNSSAQAVIDLAPIAFGEIGAIVLLIDSFMRRYTAPKGMAIGLTIVGLLSFGMTSIVYYAIWGRQPTRPELVGVTSFCQGCIDSTLDKPAPATATHNFVGTQLLGAADRCSTCGSTVKTLWLCVLLPVAPFGSYRILPIGRASVVRSEYLGRKTVFNLRQVLLVYAFDLTIVLILFVLIRK